MEELKYAKTEEQKQYWQKLRPLNLATASDTYKRTMSGSSSLFSDNKAIYYSAARKPLGESEDGKLIVAGIEKILYPWFLNPVTKEEVASAQNYFTKKAEVKKFPSNAWQQVLENDGYLPIDIYGLPGGQTILAKDGKHVPLMVLEGPGAILSHIEAQIETMYAPIIQATKAKLFQEVVGSRFAEFGLRSEELLINHPTLMMALKIGGNFTYTSDDQSVYLFDEFKDIGTLGHEFIMAYQKSGMSLEDAQRQAFQDFVKENEKSALLADTIHTTKSGLKEALKFLKENPEKSIGPRLDSGDVASQAVKWKEMNLQNNIEKTWLVVEDGYTPKKAKETFEQYESNGFNSTEIIVGAGGYFKDKCTRDEISLAYKRSATYHDGQLQPSLKFSDSKGKESIPGNIRLYERGDTLVVAQASEEIDGKPLMQKLVENGRILYNESLDDQNKRANETWNKYEKIEYSDLTQKLIDERYEEKESRKI
jgi:nicotinic acid phosphoribosyltransferase